MSANSGNDIKITARDLRTNREKNETKVLLGYWDLWDSTGRVAKTSGAEDEKFGVAIATVLGMEWEVGAGWKQWLSQLDAGLTF